MSVRVIDRRSASAPMLDAPAVGRGWHVLDACGKEVSSARMVRQQARRVMQRAYRAASDGRNNVDWSLIPGSADATLMPERWPLVYRIRERYRNDPVARGAMRKMVDAVIGPGGFSTNAALDAERIGLSENEARDIERDIDDVWEEWQQTCDYAGNPARTNSFTELLSLRFLTELQTGEDLTIPRYVKRPWADLSFCIQVVAPDRICNPAGVGFNFTETRTAAGEDIRDGVVIGSRGQVLGIYLADQHPYSYFAFRKPVKTTFIPAWNRKTGKANFWHNFQLYRAEATRGEPALVACLMGFRTLGDYVNDTATLAHLMTMFGLVIEREEAFDPDTEGLADDDKVGSTREQLEAQLELFPNMVHFLKPGEKGEVINPNIPGPQFGEFTDKLATWIASPLALPREDVLNSYAEMNFSSAKASRRSAQRSTRKVEQYIVQRYIEPPRERVIEEAWLRGRLRLPGFENPAIRRLYLAHVTYAAPWPDLEPLKEENASKQRLANGTSSLTRECAMRGISFRAVLQERAREKAEFERLGLPLPGYLQEPMADVPGGQGGQNGPDAGNADGSGTAEDSGNA